MTNLKTCKHCLENFDISDKPSGFMANHSRWCNSNPKRDQYRSSMKGIEAMNVARKNNPNLANQFTKAKSKGIVIKVSDETKEKISNSNRRKTYNEEFKAKMSLARKKWLKENPDKHVWKRHSKFKSMPCETLKEILRHKGIEFVEEYNPIEERMFSVDIAFISKRVIFEVNGNQHYEDVKTEKLAQYYKERHDLISSHGWEVVEIPYIKVFDKDYTEALINKYLV